MEGFFFFKLSNAVMDWHNSNEKSKVSDSNGQRCSSAQLFLKNVRRWARFIPILPFIVMTLTVIVWGFSIRYHPIYVKYHRIPKYGVDIARHADGDKLNEAGNFRTTFFLQVHTFVYIISLFFITLTVVNKALETINKTAGDAIVEDNNTRMAKSTAVRLVKLHRMSVEVIKRCDECFREIVNCIFLVGLIAFIFSMRSTNFGREGYLNFDLLVVCSYAAYTIYAIILFSSSIKTKMMTCLGSILLVVHKENKSGGNMKLLALSAKLELYVEYVKLSRPYITSWGLFPVEKSVAISFAANILTYLSVLYNK